MVEARLHAMLQQNPLRMNYYKKYSEIVADYNREKDRVTLEETFARVIEFIEGLNEEQRRAVREGLSEEELALFDLLERDNLTKAQRERIKDASRTLLAELQRCIASLDNWTPKDQTQSQVKVLILNRVYESLPTPPYTDVNSDGRPDLAGAKQMGNRVSVLFGLGSGRFAPAVNVGYGCGPSAIQVGDFNGDMKPDLAVVNLSDNSASISLNLAQ